MIHDAVATSSTALAGILGGIVGGIVTSFANKYIWHSHTIPTLELGQLSKHREISDDGSIAAITYLIQVKNTGRSAATNCRGDIHFRGTIDSIGGIDGREIEVETSLIWQERQTSNRTLNRGDEAYLELLRWTLDEGNGFSFPSESGWESGAHIRIEPSGDIPPTDGEYPRERVHHNAFRNINWTVTDIRVTGELAKPIEDEFSLTWENGEFRVELVGESSSKRLLYQSLGKVRSLWGKFIRITIS